MNSCTLKNFLNSKIRSYGNKLAGFHSKKIPEAGSKYICWPVILIDSVFKRNENYYPECFLNNVNTLKKKKKVSRCITENLIFSSDNSDESDEE